MKRPFMAVLLLILALLPGCAARLGGGREARAPADPPVTIGLFPNLTHAPALVAMAEGYFEEALGKGGVAFRIFRAGPEAMEAIAAGHIDLAYVGPVPVLTHFSRGSPVQIVSGAAEGGAVLIAGPKSDVSRVSDLAGRVVAIPQFGNTQDVVLRRLLQEAGLRPQAAGGTVQVVEANPADLRGLFSQNQVQAALVPEPWGALLQSQASARLVADWNQVGWQGQYPTTVLIARNSFAEQQPEKLQAVLNAHEKALAYLNGGAPSPEALIKAINSQLKLYTGKEVSEVALSIGLSQLRFSAKVNQEALAGLEALCRQAGYTRKPVDVKNLLRLPGD